MKKKKKKEKSFYPNVKDYYVATEGRPCGGQTWWHTLNSSNWGAGGRGMPNSRPVLAT